jgi:hypothetical protein
MKLQKEAGLTTGQTLQIAYPKDWIGEKSGLDEDEFIFVTKSPKFFTGEEIELIQAYLLSIKSTQKLHLTGAVNIDPEDPLLEATHDELDRLELQEKFKNSRHAPGGGTFTLVARVLRIREQGYEGNKYALLIAQN